METKWLNCTFWEKENLDKTLKALKVIHVFPFKKALQDYF